MAIPRDQPGFDAAFAAMVTGEDRSGCSDLTDDDFREGLRYSSQQRGLTVSGADPGTLDRFDHLGTGGVEARSRLRR